MHNQLRRSVKLSVNLSATIAIVALMFGSMSAQAADNSQQSKMKTCNADATAKSLTGDDRKAYMKTCLSAAAPAASTDTGNSQQQKMKSCNADAKTKNLTGDDRKAYMKTCLSGSAATSAAH